VKLHADNVLDLAPGATRTWVATGLAIHGRVVDSIVVEIFSTPQPPQLVIAGVQRNQFNLSRTSIAESFLTWVGFAASLASSMFISGKRFRGQMIAEPSFLLRNNYAEPTDEGIAQLITLMLYRPEVI
jgi:hypothetical protein